MIQDLTPDQKERCYTSYLHIYAQVLSGSNYSTPLPSPYAFFTLCVATAVHDAKQGQSPRSIVDLFAELDRLWSWATPPTASALTSAAKCAP